MDEKCPLGTIQLEVWSHGVQHPQEAKVQLVKPEDCPTLDDTGLNPSLWECSGQLPLRIAFEDVFLRKAEGPREHDLELTGDTLIAMATRFWVKRLLMRYREEAETEAHRRCDRVNTEARRRVLKLWAGFRRHNKETLVALVMERQERAKQGPVEEAQEWFRKQIAHIREVRRRETARLQAEAKAESSRIMSELRTRMRERDTHVTAAFGTCMKE